MNFHRNAVKKQKVATTVSERKVDSKKNKIQEELDEAFILEHNEKAPKTFGEALSRPSGLPALEASTLGDKSETNLKNSKAVNDQSKGLNLPVQLTERQSKRLNKIEKLISEKVDKAPKDSSLRNLIYIILVLIIILLIIDLVSTILGGPLFQVLILLAVILLVGMLLNLW